VASQLNDCQFRRSECPLAGTALKTIPYLGKKNSMAMPSGVRAVTVTA